MRKTLLSIVFLSLAFSLPAYAAQRGGHGGGGGGGGMGRSAAAPSHAQAPARAQAPSRSEGRSYGHPGAITGHPGVSPGRYGPRMGSGYGNAYLGRAHQFSPWHGSPYFHRGWGRGWGWNGYPTFWFGGLYWGFDLWPYGSPWYWGYSDPIYIVEEGDSYYAYDDLHPGQKAAVVPQPKEEGTVVLKGGVRGDQVLVDKALAGYIGELVSFSLPAGPHTIEVKGKGPYLGEDITVLSGHELSIDVPMP